MTKIVLSKVSVLASLLLASFLFNNSVYAQSRNEVEISVLFDGTPSFDAGEPTAPTGAAPQTHTPSLDGGPNNLVIRTFDSFAFRIDWNINEDDAEEVQLVVEIPSTIDARWTPDDTGMFAGCNPLTDANPSSISADGRTLTCELGDQPEGSNGVIRPTAVLERGLDNSTFSMPTTLFTATDTGGVSDDIDVPLTVSETTNTDFIKNNPIVSGVINPSGAEEGRVFIFPISALDFAQIQSPARGVGPINDAAHVTGGTSPGPLVFFDHIWGFTPNTRLATQAELDGAEAAAGASAADFAGTPCGIYEGSGPFVSSASAPATWACDDTVSSPNYPVVQISVADFTSNPFPPILADGSTNDIDAPMILAGQIALWVPESDIQGAINSPTNIAIGSAAFFNSISVEDGDSVNIQSVDDAVEPMTQGTSGPNAAGSAGNNSVSAPLGAAPEPSGSGQFLFNHDIRFRPGPLRLNQSSNSNFNSEPRLRFDFRSTANGGAGGSLPGSNAFRHASNAVDGIGRTPRGATLTIHSMIGTTNNNDDNGSSGTLHGCTAFDPSHYDLVSFGSIPVTELVDGANTSNAGLASVVSQTSVTSNSGPIAHAYYGAVSGGNGAELSSSIFPDPDGIVPIIEFTNAPLQTFPGAGARFGVDDDGLTCANSDAGTAGWIASDDPALVTTFDSDGDGVFEGITRMRVRTSVPVEFGNYRGLGPNQFPNRLSGIQVFLQALVKADIDVQEEGQELFVLQSHAYGETDANGVPNFELFPGDRDPADPLRCRPFDSADWMLNGNDTDTTTGWCNNQFEDIGAVDSFDLTDTIDYDNRATNNRFISNAGDLQESAGSGGVAQIVQASLGFSKVNLDGLNDIVDNGQTVRFALRPRVIGSSLEALTNVRLDDPLDPRFEFVQFVSGPSTSGATCSENNGTINCRFSANNPNNPGSFEPGLPGGWSDEVIIEVRLVGGIANPDSPTVLPNEARLRSSGVGPWTPDPSDPSTGSFSGAVTGSNQTVRSSAFAFMPLPSDEAVIAKVLPTQQGTCDVVPATFTGTLAEWQARCQQIDLDGNVTFDLTIENEGNTSLPQIEFVDVFPFVGDGADPEAASNTPNQTGSTPTQGDGRSPASVISNIGANAVSFVGITPNTVPAGATLVTWVTGDAPTGISRDPARSLVDNTWCDVAGGTVQNGVAGVCPLTNDDVTAVYVLFDGGDGLAPDASASVRLELSTDGAQCNDLWTNTFGARTTAIRLPIRSNDVSVQVNCVALGSTVFFDANNNATQDAGETGIAGVTVQLFRAGDDPTLATPVATDVTGATGDYLFSGLAPGDYFVYIPTPPPAFSTSSTDIATSAADNNVDGDDNGQQLVGGGPVQSPDITLARGQEPSGAAEAGTNTAQDDAGAFPGSRDEDGNMTVDFGFFEPFSVGSVVYEDANDDGNQDSGEPGIANVTVRLLDAVTGAEIPVGPDGILGTADDAPGGVTTSATGQYNFSNLSPGDYQVEFTRPTNFIPSTIQTPDPDAPGAGQDRNLDSNLIVTSPTAATFNTGVFTLGGTAAGGEPLAVVDPDGVLEVDPSGTPDANSNLTIDAGFVQTLSLGNIVWEDVGDLNSTYDAGTDTPVAGAVVTLLRLDNDPTSTTFGQFVAAGTQTTGSNGEYNFDGLAPGDYRVQVTPPTGLVPVPVQVADPDGATGLLDVDNDSNIDLTATTPAGTFESGTVTLLADTEPDGTDGDGPNGNQTVDFGFYTPLSIGSVVFNDDNGNGLNDASDANGIQDTGEPGINGSTVTLFVTTDGGATLTPVRVDANGVYDSNQTGASIADASVITSNTINGVTAVDGSYNFSGLPAGDYVVRVTPASGFAPTSVQNPTVNDGTNLDSNIDLTATTPAGSWESPVIEARLQQAPTGAAENDAAGVVEVDPSGTVDAASNLTVDFGFIERVSLGSTLWLDSDNDGTQDVGEPTLEGATVTLLNADGTEFDSDPVTPGIQLVQTTTNADGEYNFNDLMPGDYRVGVDLTTVTNFDGTRLRPSPVQVADPNATDANDDSNIDTASPDQDISNSLYQSGIISLGVGEEPIGELDDLGAAGAGATDQPGQDTNDLDANGNMTLDLGFVPTGRIGDLILADIDGDGVLDPADGDVGLGGVTVILTPPAGVDLGNGPGQPITTITAVDGSYLFEGLPPANDYVVTVDTSTLPGTLGTDLRASFDPDGGLNNTSTTDLVIGADGQVIDDLDQDFGYVPLGVIGDTIWYDTNADGIQDAGEQGIAGVTVQLTPEAGVDLGNGPGVPITMVTDSNGMYLFTGLPPGDYQVDVINGLLPEYTQTGDPDGTLDNQSTVTLSSTNTGAGGAPEVIGNLAQDFGYVEPVSIGSFIWNDLNGDGIQDTNEPPIAGAPVTLWVDDGSGNFIAAVDQAGVPLLAAASGADGSYLFDNLPSGDYKVAVTPPSGFAPSLVQTATDDDVTENDSNIAGVGTAPNSFESGVFTLLGGSEPTETGANRGDGQDIGGSPTTARDESGNMTVDFGFVELASLGNYVWLDLDMDGVQDASEDGIANVTVNLLVDTNGNGIIDGTELTTPIATATTGPNGEYLFPDLLPGVVYQTSVDVSTLPPGLVQTFDEGDGVGATDSLSDPIILDPNEFHETADFGYAPPAGLGAVGDTIWVDADDDGVQDPGEPGIAGVTVSLTPAPGVDLGNGPGVPITTVTDANGKYLFPGLPLDATYIVEVDITTLPTGYASGPSNLGDPDVRDGNSSIADNQTIVVITASDPINLDLDFGYLPPADQNNSIGDTLWIDVDEDGNGPSGAGDGSDVNELPLPGVTVSLVDLATGAVIATTVTDANGMYLFSGIPDGTYEVQVTDQNNVLAGLDPTSDSDDAANPGAFVPVTPNVSVVDLDSGSTNPAPFIDLDQDFGYVDSSSSAGDGSIGDTIFLDMDNSGTPDAGEGLEGVVVQLFGPGPDGVIGGGDDVLLASTTTDVNGNYLFTGLDTSDTGPNLGTEYQVVVDTSTLPNGGAGLDNTVDPDTTGTGDSESVTTLTATDPVDLDQDFGYTSNDNNSIMGTVFPDTNGDGTQQEAGSFAGVTIELQDENGNVIGTTVTDADGNYEFTGLPDGIYMVVVTDDNNVLNGFDHTDSPNGPSDTSDQTSKDDTGYIVDLDSAGTNDDPVVDETGDFGYMPVITNPISLGSFIATAADDGEVLIQWTTQTEVANLGFKLYGRIEGEWVQLNDSLVLGLGDSVSTQRYEFVVNSDATVFAISDVDLTGKETLHGPYQLGTEYGGVSDRKVIDWESEKAERDRKGEQRKQLRMQQQQLRLNQRLRATN